MKKRVLKVLAAGLAVAFLAACGGGNYQVPRDEFKRKVRTLAVLPILVDEQSNIRHPEAQKVVDLLRRHSEGREKRLAELMRDAGSFFDVREVTQKPDDLATRLLVRVPAESGADALPYDFSGPAARRLTEEYVVDALLVIILHGRDVIEKRWDRTRLNYLEAPYNGILAAALVIDRSGTVLWRLDEGPGTTFFTLQYPDFDEARYNKTQNVALKFLTLGGIERTLEESEGGLIGGEDYPKLYADLFDRICKALEPGLMNPFARDAR
ncbi:MAG: hypothetical protein AB7F20_14690 [Geoalkalibacter sp.]|jgi:hypothetical protein|uniref:hypothetical protein n=1 Tax=Geoalkalibacter sp. TaxID=3041440 RepID=UPI003D0E9364